MPETRPATPPPPPAAPPTKRRRPLWPWFAGLAALLVVLLAGAVPALMASLRSPSGTAWWLARLPGVTVTAPEGALLGDFSATALDVDTAGSTVRLRDVRWRGLDLTGSSVRGAWVALKADTVEIGRVEVIDKPLPPQPATPTTAPRDLRLPVTAQIGSLKVGEVKLAALGEQPIRDIEARISVGADDGARHRIELTQLAWGLIRLSGFAQAGADGDMPVDAQLALSQAALTNNAAGLRAPPLAGTLKLQGPLQQLALQATLRSVDAQGTTAAATATASGDLLDANALVQPFASWPVSALEARVNKLDLARFTDAAPKTELSGTASVASPAVDQPATLQLAIDNALAGLWSDTQLPLRRATLTLLARPDQAATSLTLRELVAELGSATKPAGRISLTGRNDTQGWAVDARLQDVRPDALDARAPQLTLSGPLSATGSAPATDKPQTLALKGELAGQLLAAGLPGNAPRDVTVDLDAGLVQQPNGGMALDLRRTRLAAGPSQAALNGKVVRDATAAPWQVKLAGDFRAFDPLLWWPGARESALRRGATQINGTAAVDLVWKGLPADAQAPETPASAAKTATQVAGKGGAPVWQAVFAAFTGQAQLKLANSQVAGVPLQADLSVGSDDQGAGRADAALNLADNKLVAKARLAAQPAPGDLAEFDIRAPALQKLQPLMNLLPASGPPPKKGAKPTVPALAGQVEGQASLRGRWPDVSSQGKLTIRGLAAGADNALKTGDVQWKLGTTVDAPAQIDAALRGLLLAGQPVESADVALKGTARAHQFELKTRAALESPQRGAPAAKNAQGEATPPRKAADLLLKLQGGLRHDAPALAVAQGSGTTSAWQGTVQELVAADVANPGAPWLQARGLQAAVQWSDAAMGVELQPGRIDFKAGPTASAIRWTKAVWQQARSAPNAKASAAAQFDVQATLDPVAVAPLLAHLQPELGWDGDLVIGGRVSMKSSPAVSADIVVERQKGDLVLTTDDGTRQALGLTELRVALTANNGTWTFTPRVAGKATGTATGSVVARTAPGALLPDAGTPVQGGIDVNVSSLEALASWVPTGWRVGGSVQSRATVGGTLGGPELTGRVNAQKLSVRNVLQGVNITDGEVAVTLSGDSARIERFVAKAGSGTLTITGGAKLGASPNATLQLVADKFQVLGRVDMRVVASGQAQLRIASDRIALDGKLAVDEGLIDFTKGDAPSLSDDVVVTRAKPAASAPAMKGATPGPGGTVVTRGGAQPEGPAAAQPVATPRTLAMNITLSLGEQLRLKGRGLNTRLAGDLKITAPGGAVAVNGQVRTVGGNYAAYGQKMTIDRGLLTFSGAPGNPRLDIEATRPQTDIRVGVQVTGNAINPRVRLFSEPDLPEVDKLSWLVLGRTSGGLGRTDTALLQRAAVALLSGEEEGVTTQLTKAIGLDDISLRQTDGEVKETIVTLGKQINERVYVGYERGLNGTTGYFQLIYRIAQRFTLRGQTGSDNAIDAVYTWRWK